MFPSETKRKIRHFYVVVVQRRLRNVQKSVIHVQSCCFDYPNLLLFCRSRCRRIACHVTPWSLWATSQLTVESRIDRAENA